MRRMDRYSDEITEEKISRSDKNKDLYQNVGTNTRYTNITDVTNANAIDITNTNSDYKTREDYHKMKKYNSDIPTPKVKKELEDFNNLYNKHENRVYDINNVLEEARKNRQEDDLEEKRKLKNTSYNILANLNTEELEKYRQEKRDRLTKGDDELREMIDTIASKTLAGELEAASDLLSDLMATSIMDKVDKPVPDKKVVEDEEKEAYDADEEPDDNDTNYLDNEIPEDIKIVIQKEEITIDTDEESAKDLYDEITEIKKDIEQSGIGLLNKDEIEEVRRLNEKLAAVEEKKEQEETESKTTDLANKDQDFYTRSMDLSAEDFELEEEFKDKKIPSVVKVLIVMIILIAVVIAYVYLNK